MMQDSVENLRAAAAYLDTSRFKDGVSPDPGLSAKDYANAMLYWEFKDLPTSYEFSELLAYSDYIEYSKIEMADIYDDGVV